MLDKVFQFFKWAKGVYEGSEALKAIYTVFTVVTAVVGVKGFLQARQMMAKGQDIMANKTAAGGKIPVIYGTRRVGCQVVYMDTAQNRSKDLFVVYALSVGECSEIVPSSIEIDGNSILDGNIYKGGGYVGSDRNGQTGFSHHQPLNTASQVGDVQYSNAGTLGTNPALRYSFVFNLHHGASSQTADPMLRASIPTEWTTNHKLNGICYIAAAFDYDKKGMYKGVPQITVQVKGKKVYDPRESDHTFGDPSTYEWSSNPALCFLDYITNDEYGKGLAESQINMTAIGTAADKCNTKVDQPYYNGSYQDVTWSGDSGDDFIVIDDNADWWQNKVDEFIDIRDVNDTSIFSDDITIKGSTRYEFYDDTQENRLYIDGTLSSTYTNEAGSAKAQVKRFHCNGYIDTNKNVMDNAKELLANMRGILNYVNGKYELQIEDTGTSTFSITDDHIIADAGISVDYGNKDKKANKVVIEFFNANKKYELDTATVLHDASPEYYSDDGEVLEIKAEFPYVTDPYIAYNMGKAILTRSRNQTTMQFLGTPEMYKLNVGDIVDLTYSGLGFSAKPCRVEALELQANGLVSVSLIEYFDVYTWEVPAQESVEILAKIPTIGAIHPPEANSIVFTDTDDSPINRPTLTWTEPTDFPVKEFRVDVEDTSNPPVQVFSKLVNTNSVDLSFLPTGNYNAIITSINGVGIESADVTKAFTIGDPPTATADIQDDAVVTDKITDDAITTPKILDNAVTDAKINSLTANKITAGTIDASVITVTNLDADNITSGSIGADKITVDDLSAINSDLGDIDAGSLNIGSGAFVVTTAGAMTATSADVVGNLKTGNLVVTGDAGIHGEVRATSITAETVTVESIKQEVWNEIDRRTAPAQNGFYDDFSSTGTDGYYVGVAKNFDLLGTNDNGYQINSNDIDLRAGMVTGFATSTNYTGTALEATFQYFYKLASGSTWTALTPSYVGTTDKYTTPDGYFYELDADPSHRINSGTLTAESYYHFRLTVTPTVTNNVWTDSDAGSGYKVEYGVQQSSTGTGAGTGTVTSVSGGDGITASPSSITTTGSLAVDSTVVRTTGTQTLGGNKTFSDNVVIQGNLDVQGTTTTIDTANLDVKDKNITLNYSTGDSSASANGAGITIQDAVSSTQDATLTWNTANDSFNFSHDLNVIGDISSSADVSAQSFTASSSGYGTIELGGVSGAYIDLKTPNTDDFDLRLITTGTGGQIDTGSGDLVIKRQGSTRISTTSTGIDVTGTVTADGLTVDGAITSTSSITGRTGTFTGQNGTALQVNSGTTNVIATFESGDATAWINLKDSNSSTYGTLLGAEGGLFRLRTNNNDDTTDLTVDTSGNLSVSGTISSGAITSTGTSTFGVATASSYKVGASTVISSSRNLLNIGTISSGDIDVSATNTNGLSIIDSSNSSAAPLIKVQGNRQDANESQSFTGGLALSALQTNALANDGKHIGTIYFGTNHTNGTAGNIAYSASISARLSGAANSATDMPTDLVFYTGSSGTSLGTANTTFGTQALKLDSSQNATFAGTISNSAFTIPNSIGTAGQVLKVPSSGTTLEWGNDTGLITGITNFADNRLLTASGSTTINGEADLTWNDVQLAFDSGGGSSGSLGAGGVVGSLSSDVILTSTNRLVLGQGGYGRIYIDGSDVNVSGNLEIGGVQVISSARNMSNIGTISSGGITSTGASSIGSGTLHVSATENRVGINTNSHIGTVLNVLDVDDEGVTLRLHTNTNSHNPVLRMNAKNSSGSQQYADIKYNPDSPSLNFHVPYNESTPTLKIADGSITVDGTISSGAITSSGASSGRYTGLEVVNTTNAGGTETAIGLGVVAAGNNACDVKLVANRVGANSGSDFYIEQTDSSGSQQETFRITESGNATFSGTISSGAITVSGSAGTLASFTNASDADLLIKAQSGITTLTPTTGTLAFGTSSTERVRIDSSGNVGIGTTLFTTNSYIKEAVVKSTVTDGVARYTLTTTDNALGAAISLSSFNDANTLSFGLQTSYDEDGTSAPTPRMTINSSGNVGIGTTSPAVALDIAGSSTTQMRIQMSGQADTRVLSDTGTGIVGTYNNHPLTIKTNGSNVATFDTSGNVIVGHTAADDTTASASLRYDGRIYSTVSGDQCLSLNRLSSDGEIITFKKDSLIVGNIGVSSSNELFLGGTADTDAFIRMGYSTIAPATSTGTNRDAAISFGASNNRFKDLYLSGSAKLVADSATSAEIQLKQTGFGGRDYRIISTGSGYGSVGALAFYDATASSEIARFDSSANLLVGKTDLTGNVAGISLRSTGLIVGTVASGTVGYFNRTTSDGTILDFRKDNVQIGSIGVEGGNNLFIGSTALNHSGLNFTANAISPMLQGSLTDATIALGTPSRRFTDLHLSGTANANKLLLGTTAYLGTGLLNVAGGIDIADNSYVYLKLKLGNNQSIVETAGTYQNMTVGTTGTSSYLRFKTAATERMRIDSSGKVGIGTSSLTNKFHVSGNARIEGNLMAGGASASNVPARPIHIKSSGDSAAIRIEDTTSSNQSWDLRSTYGTGLLFIDSTRNQTRMTINDSGNVGISKNNPSARLEVAGSSNSTYLIVGGDDSSNSRGLTFASSAGANFNGAIHTITAPSSQGEIVFVTGTSEAMRIDSSQDATFTGDIQCDGNINASQVGANNITGDVLQINGTTVVNNARNLTNIGTITSTGLVKIDANNTLNPLHIHDDSTTGHPGMFVTNTASYATSTQNFYAKQYGSAVSATIFGQSVGGKAFVGTEGSANSGLLIGTITADSVWIGTNNTAALTINSSQDATFAGTLTANSVLLSGLQLEVLGVASGELLVGAVNDDDIITNIKGFGGSTSMEFGDGTINAVGSTTINHSKSSTANPILALKNTSTTNEGRYLQFTKNTGSFTGQIGTVDQTESNLFISTFDTGLKFESYIAYKAILPCGTDGADVDNTIDLGSSSVRFDDIYATNGTIQTSDRNLKQDIQSLTDAEQRVATACKGLIRRFRWQDSVQDKDNNPDSDETARYHFGVIAQDLQDAFEAEGLDASDYGMFISSTWTDDDGVEQTRLGVRYNELLSFIITTL